MTCLHLDTVKLQPTLYVHRCTCILCTGWRCSVMCINGCGCRRGRSCCSCTVRSPRRHAVS